MAAEDVSSLIGDEVHAVVGSWAKARIAVDRIVRTKGVHIDDTYSSVSANEEKKSLSPSGVADQALEVQDPFPWFL